ncbi:MAG: aspartate-semialdehyde dehydrogenase [Bacteriovoracaceae bacterium]
MKKFNVAILGATGTVGQKAISMLANHPFLQISEIAASSGNAGKRFGDVVNWRDESDLPQNIADMILKNPKEVTAPYAISALPSESAAQIEPYLAEKGIHIFSNASTYRMDEKTPLLIPEINPDHINLIQTQKTKGKIVTNPNCSTVMLACALKPLMSLGKLTHVSVVTLQAASGAGYPGVPSLDLIGNTIPFIGSEEDKVETESLKILGLLEAGTIKNAPFDITCHVNRVPVADGHSVIIHAFYEKEVKAESVTKAFMENNQLYKVHSEDNRPQPKRDLTAYDMRIHIGRIKQGATPNVVGLLSLGHNLVRGAAGAAIINLEHFLKSSGEL